MKGLPGAVFVIDPKKEHIAVKEANKLGIPVVALCDTNCDPTGITHVIPGNDDAIKSIRLFTAALADAALDGQPDGPMHRLSLLRWLGRVKVARSIDAEEAAPEASAAQSLQKSTKTALGLNTLPLQQAEKAPDKEEHHGFCIRH